MLKKIRPKALSFASIFDAYFAKHQPKRAERYAHSCLIASVALQYVLASIMEVPRDEIPQTFWYSTAATYGHVANGILLLVSTLLLTYYALRHRGPRCLFPYLYGRLDGIKRDISNLFNVKSKFQKIAHAEKSFRHYPIIKEFTLSRPRFAGIATSIMGLGLALELGTAVFGFIWFVLWTNDWVLANAAKELHKLSVAPLLLFYVVHGGMGFMHIFNFHAEKQLQQLEQEEA